MIHTALCRPHAVYNKRLNFFSGIQAGIVVNAIFGGSGYKAQKSIYVWWAPSVSVKVQITWNKIWNDD